MKHYILVKWKDSAIDPDVGEIQKLFEETLNIPGIHSVSLRRNVVSRPNRYDLMILMQMETDALESYDASQAHLEWKRRYGELIAQKAIFDCD